MSINRRALLGGTTALAAAGLAGSALAAPQRRKPNFIVILCDDMGFGDIQPFGGVIPTPNLSRMAREGRMATDYYAPANICTPSRAGLLTGRYPVRTGLGYEVILAGDDRGLPLSEVTIANTLKPAGYATALVGKWHLGQVAPFWPPTQHGFDRFFGIPYSHDIEPLALFDATVGTEPRKVPFDLHTLQQQFHLAAEQFIETNRDRPFFLELALSAPHLPEYPYKSFKGRTRQGAYGDVIVEIDAIVGRVLDKLRQLSLDRDTLVLFTSDNGPWFEGSTGPLRDRKGGAGYDGAYRVPFIAWQPGTVPAGTRTDAIMCGIDLLPTFCQMASTPLPNGVELDGQDIGAILKGTKDASPHDEILLFHNEDVVGIRTQKWKYVQQSFYRASLNDMVKRGYPQLYDAAVDTNESYSVAEAHSDVVTDMQRRLAAAQARFAPYRKGIPPFFANMRRKTLEQQLREQRPIRVQD